MKPKRINHRIANKRPDRPLSGIPVGPIGEQRRARGHPSSTGPHLRFENRADTRQNKGDAASGRFLG